MAKLDVAIDAGKAVAGARDFNGAIAAMRVAARQGGQALAGATVQTVAFGAALIALPIAVLAVEAVIIRALVTSSIKASKAMLDVAGAAEEIQSKFQAVFKEEAPRAGKRLAEFAAAAGRSNVKLQEMAGTVQDTLVPLGLSRDIAADLSVEMTQLATDVASFNNAMDQNVIDNFQSAMTGASRAVLGYGVVIRQDLVEQEALNLGLAKTVGALEEQDKVMARAVILFRSTADAQGDAARTSESYQNTLKRLNATVFDLQAEIGVGLTEAFRIAANEGVGVDDAMIAVEITLLTVAEAAKDVIAGIGAITREMIELARLSPDVDRMFEERRLRNFARRMVDVGKGMGVTNESAAAMVGQFAAAAHVMQQNSDGALTMAEAIRAIRTEAERDFELAAFAAYKEELVGMGIAADDVEAAHKQARDAAQVFGAAIDEEGEKIRAIRDEMSRQLAPFLSEIQAREITARIDALVERFRAARADISVTPEVRTEAFVEARTTAEDQLAQAISARRSAMEALGPSAERNVQIDILAEKQLAMQSAQIAANNEARRIALSLLIKDVQLSAKDAHAINEVNRALHGQEEALLAANLELERKARAEREAAVFAQDHAMMLNVMDDGLSGLGQAAGAAAVGFEDFGVAADRALRSMVANMISATFEAAAFMAVIKPLLSGAFGLGNEQIAALFPSFARFLGSAKGNMFDNGMRVDKFALGGFPAGLITGPTAFGLRGGIGIAGERGREVGFHERSAIAPLKKDPVTGELGVRMTGGGGPTYQFSTTIHMSGGGGRAADAALRRSVRHYENDLRRMPARIGA